MMKYQSLLSAFALFALGIPSFPQNNNIRISDVKYPGTASSNKYYVSNKTPLEPLRFIKLPVGSIRPTGWVLKYLELQRDGLTGQLQNISAWLDKKNNAWFSGNGQGDHGWEEVPYWLKGYGDLGYILKDDKIINETKLWLEKVFQSQQPDGYFGPSIIEKEHQNNNDGSSPDLWPNMLMLWCMQSYYDYSHDPRVISFMTKYFKWEASVPDEKLLKLYWENSRGGDNLFSIYWLYNRTGEKWLLDLAGKIHRNTANWSQKDKLPNWHNVNIAQCFREPATYFMHAKDSSLLKATYNDFHLVRNLYGQVPGGMFGADENAREGYSDPHQAVETCGMVEQMASDEILTAISGDPMWADNCENVAFNTYPAAFMPDFRALRYLTAPNMVVSDSKNHSPGLQNEGPFLMMNPFSSRCCQHNHAQGWPYYAEHLWMATPDNGIAAILYSSSEATVKVANGNSVTLKQTTNYPFDENIKIEISTSNAVQFPLYLRIPGWCGNASVTVNGQMQNIKADPDSYLRIEKKWNEGDTIIVSLPMEIRIKEWTKNKNSISINYGPLTLSLKIKEDYKKMSSKETAIYDSKWRPDADQSKWPSYEIFPASLWNYGIVLTNAPLSEQFTIIKKKWPDSNYPFTPDESPIEVRTKGRLISWWTLDHNGLCGALPQSPVTTDTEEEEIELIPMGAARLRISSFPVAK